LSDLPKNPYEKVLYDRTYKKWTTVSLLACFLAPGVLFAPFFGPDPDASTLEIVGGIAVLLQLLLLFTIPHRVASFAASRELVSARRDGDIPPWSPPQPAPAAERTKEIKRVTDKLTLVRGPGRLDYVVEFAGGRSQSATPELAKKMGMLRMQFLAMEDLPSDRLQELLWRADHAFCFAVLGVDPSATIFRDQSASEIALLMRGQYDRSRPPPKPN
jgi:hypothetical protein